jgi:hypothetical protein
MLKHLFIALKRGRCFRVLETLTFNEFSCRGITGERISKQIREVMKRLHFLMRISISNWPRPLNFQLSLFQYTDTLTQIVLRKQDMVQRFDSIYFPNKVNLLDLSESHFTFPSLLSLFEAVSGRQTSLSLVLQDLVIPETHWFSFFDLLPTFPPITCLCELDWSGNPLPPNSLSNFVNYFFKVNHLRFLAIDRIFHPLQSSFSELCSLIPSNSLYGLSLGGNVHDNFSGHFKELASILDHLGSLSLLYLDGQRMIDSDSSHLVNYAQRRSLLEVSIDRSLLSPEGFFHFYDRLSALPLPAIGRPEIDISRLFGSVPNHPSFADFQSKLSRRLPVTSRTARCAFFASKKRDFHDFVKNFHSDRNFDRYGLVLPIPKSGSQPVITLASISKILGMEEADPVVPPTYPPEVREERDFERASEGGGGGGGGGGGPLMEERPDIYIEPLWYAPEIRVVIAELGGFQQSGDEEEEELPGEGRKGSQVPVRAKVLRSSSGNQITEPVQWVERPHTRVTRAATS